MTIMALVSGTTGALLILISPLAVCGSGPALGIYLLLLGLTLCKFGAYLGENA